MSNGVNPRSSTKSVSAQLDSGNELSFQVYQDVYNRLTGRSEKIRRMFFDKHSATLEHILNLNTTIEQAVEQYTCHSSTVSISAYYVDGTSERWSSFEKFRMQAPTKSICTDYIEIEYDFLLTLPKAEDPRPYKLIVGLRSEVGFQKKLDNDRASDFERKMAIDVTMGTARLSISYVDLVVARSFEAFVTNWHDALPKATESFTQKFIRMISPGAGFFTRILVISTVSVLCYKLLSQYVSDTLNLFQFGLISGTLLMIANIASFKVAEKITNLLHSFKPLSIVRLSAADDLAKAEQTKKSSKLAIVGMLSWVGIVVTGVFVNFVSKYFLG